MRILLLTPFPPYPPNSGGRIRIWEEIRYLSRDHSLTVASLFAPEELPLERMLEPYCERVIAIQHANQTQWTKEPSGQHYLPIPVSWYTSERLRVALQSLYWPDYDLVIVHFIYMTQYLDVLPSHKVVLEEHNVESSILRQVAEHQRAGAKDSSERRAWLRQKSVALQLASYEERVWPRFPLRIVVSEKDKHELDRRCAGGRSLVVENGVDVQSTQALRDNDNRRVLFMGTMEYLPNVDAVSYLAEDIMPRVWQQDDNIMLVVAGKNPPAEIVRLREHPRIEVIVNPADMTEVAKTCSFTVVPLRLGGGTRIKILHAMAMGLPVISTGLGCEGLEVRDERDLIVSDDPEQFAHAIVRLGSDTNLRDHLRANGRRLAESRYDWEKILALYEAELLAFASVPIPLGHINP